MSLRGEAFLAIWNDLKPGETAAWNQWHTLEHMPERVTIPGFQRGRRYITDQVEEHQHFTLYEVTDFDVFSSETYLQRLNNPTEWSVKRLPAFTNFLRSICQTQLSSGKGVGGFLSTIRIYTDGGITEAVGKAATTAAEHAVSGQGVVGSHYGTVDNTKAPARTKEREIRGNADAGQEPYDALLMIEGLTRSDVDAASARAVQLLKQTEGIKNLQPITYELVFELNEAEYKTV